MYSVVLMAALTTTTADVPSFGGRGCHGCWGARSGCYGCNGCYGYGGCYGGCNGGCWGCYGNARRHHKTGPAFIGRRTSRRPADAIISRQ